MKKLLLLIVLISTQVCNAQNYQCLQAGVKHYFINGNGYLRGIRIDSVKTYTDSVVYYPFHTPRGDYAHSYMVPLDVSGGSWLGKKVIQLSDGTFLFDNLWHDTIVIKTQANVGDSWIFYNDTTSLYYNALLISVDTLTVLGVLDSVKKILITAHDPSGIVAGDPADSAVIVLSKNFGFVNVCDLYTFPYHKPDSTYMQGMDYYLDLSISYIPLPLPALLDPPFSATGINLNTIVFKLVPYVVPTYNRLYSWNIGDVYEYSSCNGLAMLPSTSCDPVNKYELDSVINSAITAVASGYDVSGLNGDFIANPYPYPYSTPYHYSLTTFSDTLNYDTTSPINMLYMPEEYLQTQIHFYIPNDTTQFCSTGPIYEYTNNLIVDSQYFFGFEGPFTTYVYKAPLGLLHYYKVTGDAGYVVGDKTLLYCYKGGVGCGRYHLPDTTTYTDTVTSVNKVIYNSGYKISPNPATDQLTIKTVPIAIGTPYTISIINPLGQTIKTLHSNKQQETINVSNLPAGVYNVSITDESGGRANEKVVILH